jgi:hypothetical protein
MYAAQGLLRSSTPITDSFRITLVLVCKAASLTLAHAGRREQTSLAIYVAFDGPLDQYYMQNPGRLFGSKVETPQVDPQNAALLAQHVMCAAEELSLVPAVDAQFFGQVRHMPTGPCAIVFIDVCTAPCFSMYRPRCPSSKCLVVTLSYCDAQLSARSGCFCQSPRTALQGIHAAVESLRVTQKIGFTPADRNALRYIGGEPPARGVSLRAIEPEAFSIIDVTCSHGAGVLETIEASKAFWEVYDGAIYLFQGRSYLCRRLDLERRVAEVAPADVRYFTTVVDRTDVHVCGGNVAYAVPGQGEGGGAAGSTAAVDGRGTMPPISARSGPAVITLRFMGFLRVWRGSGIAFDRVNLFLPDVQFTTEAAYVRCVMLLTLCTPSVAAACCNWCLRLMMRSTRPSVAAGSAWQGAMQRPGLCLAGLRLMKVCVQSPGVSTQSMSGGRAAVSGWCACSQPRCPQRSPNVHDVQCGRHASGVRQSVRHPISA